MKISNKQRFYIPAFFIFILLTASALAFAAKPDDAAEGMTKGMSLWQLLVAGGSTMIFLGMVSVAATASVIYHFYYVTPERLTPPEFIENLLVLLEKKENEKALSVCKTQSNIVSAIAAKGIKKVPKGKAVVEEAVQYEGKEQIERLWQNLSYLGDMAVIAPMLGLLGTVLGMIEAFNYQAFKAGMVKPLPLAQGLAKAMITTAFGLIIAVPILVFYAYFRGRIARITQNTERAASEIVHSLNK